MTILKIIYEPNKNLHTKALEVEKNDKTILKTLQDMQDTLATLNGIGLAATQVNIMKRLIVIDLRGVDDYDDNHKTHENDKKLFLMINPKILKFSSKKLSMNEGCLSLPTIRSNIIRPSEIDLEYYDEKFNLQTIHASGLFAKCIQHEIDHLNGITMIDYMSQLKKDISIKKIKKIVQNMETETAE